MCGSSSISAKVTIVAVAIVIDSVPAWGRLHQEPAVNAGETTAPPPSEPPPEIGRTLLQGITGSAAALAGLLLAISSGNDAEQVTWIVQLGTPAGVGTLVGVIGNGGAYESSVGWAIAGAYAGAATVVPLTWVAVNRSDGHSDPREAMFAIFVAWLVVQPLAATAAWHIWKEPRPGYEASRPTPSIAATSRPARDPTIKLRSPLPGQLTIPLFSAAF